MFGTMSDERCFIYLSTPGIRAYFHYIAEYIFNEKIKTWFKGSPDPQEDDFVCDEPQNDEGN